MDRHVRSGCFLPWCFLGMFPCAGRSWGLTATGDGGPDPKSMPQGWAVSSHVLCLQEGGGIHGEQGSNPSHDLSTEYSCLVGQSLPAALGGGSDCHGGLLGPASSPCSCQSRGLTPSGRRHSPGSAQLPSREGTRCCGSGKTNHELEQLLRQCWCEGLLGSGRALRHMWEVAGRMAGASQAGLEGLSPGCQDMGCLWSCIPDFCVCECSAWNRHLIVLACWGWQWGDPTCACAGHRSLSWSPSWGRGCHALVQDLPSLETSQSEEGVTLPGGKRLAWFLPAHCHA